MVAVREYPISQTPYLQRKIFSLFEDSKNGPRIIKLSPLNHHIDFHGNSEYLLQVAVKLSLVIFHRELSYILQTACVIVNKTALSLHGLRRVLPNHCFTGKKYHTMCFIIFG